MDAALKYPIQPCNVMPLSEIHQPACLNWMTPHFWFVQCDTRWGDITTSQQPPANSNPISPEASLSHNHLLQNRQGYSLMTLSMEHLPRDESRYGILNILGVFRTCIEADMGYAGLNIEGTVVFCECKEQQQENEVHFMCVMFCCIDV